MADVETIGSDDDAETAYQTGRQLVVSGIIDDGVRELWKAVRARPDNHAYTTGAVYALMEKKKLDEATLFMLTEIERFPDRPGSLRVCADVLIRRKLYPYAETALRRLIEKSTTRIADDLRRLGTCLLLQRRYPEARVLFDEAFDIAPLKARVTAWIPEGLLAEAIVEEPDWRWAQYHLARSYFLRRVYRQALELIEPIVKEKDAVFAAAAELYCEIIIRTCNKELAVEAISELLTAHPEPGAFWYHFYEGLLAYHKADYVIADWHYTLARNNYVSDLPSSIGCLSFWLSPPDRPFIGTKPSPLIFDELDRSRVTENDKFICFTACDSKYFKSFAMAYLKGTATTCGDLIMHCHIVNPDDDCARLIEDIRSHAPRLRLNVTSERVDFKLPKPYFATVRYLRAPEVMRAYARPLLVTDIDGWLVTNPGGIENITKIGLKPNAARLELPWCDMLATTTWLPIDEQTVRFLDLVSEYFWRVYDPSIDNWFIDQSVLNYAARNMPTVWIDLAESGHAKMFRTYGGTETKETLASQGMGMTFPDWARG